MSRKMVMIVSLILIAGTLCTVGIMYRTDPNEATRTAYEYRNVTQDFARTTVTTSIEEARNTEVSLGYMPGSGNVGTMPGGGVAGGQQGDTTGNQHVDQTTGLTYQGITTTADGLKYQKQQSPYWDSVKSNTSMSGYGCWIFALASAGYNKYGIPAAPGTQIEDAVMQIYPNATVGVDGYLQCAVDSVGQYSNMVFPGGVEKFYKVNYTTYSGATDSKGWPTEDGEYIVYYTHAETNAGLHWMYIEVHSGNILYGNSYSGSGKGTPWQVSTGMRRIFKLV